MADANELMDLEMLDTIVGGKMCETCALMCSQACSFGGKDKHQTTEPPTPTNTNTNTNSNTPSGKS